ncbi:MAG: hypothetical protein A2X48_20405 [Lentisphaerae bacterium GWF2_49_21]|nr:MAG: hypothetical protein A2X48_20405 [Lentisphaerae bacterium GWF2_49_21]
MKTGIIISATPQNSPDILYASGFNAPDPFVFVICGRQRTAYVSPLEHSRATTEMKSGIKVYELVEGSIKTTLKTIVQEHPGTTWTVPQEFPFHLAEFMRQNSALLACPENQLFPERSVKSGKELKEMLKALRLAEKAMAKAVEVISNSSVDSRKRLVYGKMILTSEYLQTVIDVEILSGGGIAEGTISSCGKHSAEPHNRGAGHVYAGQPIVIDIFPRLKNSGYWGDITRTFVKGRIPRQVLKAYCAVKDARDFSKTIIRSGAIASDVYLAAMKILEKHGFKTGKSESGNYGFFHSLGHGVGLEIHEEPRLSPKNNKPLETGNVVTVEPGLYYPEWGGVRLEDTVVVKKSSADTITRFPTFLEIE